MTAGLVAWFNADEGWGVIDSAETPGGCFVHWADLEMGGYKHLVAGQRVEFTWEKPGFLQDGYAYRAIRVVPEGASPPDPMAAGDEGAYRSWLVVSRDEESDG